MVGPAGTRCSESLKLPDLPALHLTVHMTALLCAAHTPMHSGRRVKLCQRVCPFWIINVSTSTTGLRSRTVTAAQVRHGSGAPPIRASLGRGGHLPCRHARHARGAVGRFQTDRSVRRWSSGPTLGSKPRSPSDPWALLRDDHPACVESCQDQAARVSHASQQPCRPLGAAHRANVTIAALRDIRRDERRYIFNSEGGQDRTGKSEKISMTSPVKAEMLEGGYKVRVGETWQADSIQAGITMLHAWCWCAAWMLYPVGL